MENYFNNFPTITYNGTTIADLSRNVQIISSVLRKPEVFYRYQIDSHDRPDNLAYFIYEDPELEWILFLMNGITDPYYDWCLSQEQIDSLVVNKYGSIEAAQDKISHYRTAWADDDRQITVSYYENNLDNDLKKYWEPVFGVGNNILAYKRKEEDNIVNTNRIVELDVTFSEGDTVIVNEIIDFYEDDNRVGMAQVVSQSDTTIYIQHTRDQINVDAIGKGRESNTIFTINTTTIIQRNISDEEIVYWEPAYYYDLEIEKNERNRNITLLQPEFSLQLVEALRKKLKE